MDKLNKIDRELLVQIADLHEIPQGSYNIRKNGKLFERVSTEDIEIVPKSTNDGIDIIVKPDIKNKSVHIPVIVTEGGFNDLVYNDFYIGENAEVTIIAGCGIHNNSNEKSGHNGIHTFHIGKNARVVYIEKHLGLGKGEGEKVLNPVTNIIMEENSYLEMQTVQLGGVTYSNRKTKAKLGKNSELNIAEKILTTDTQQVKTIFDVDMAEEGCKCNVVSRSVARDNSLQEFKSKLIGKSACFGRVECDAILLDNARVKSVPEIDARCVDAVLNHEATVGKIAGEQLLKLMTLGLTEQEAEDVIIKGYLK